MNKTGIEYLTHTWNPIAMRCSKVSEGCKNCWHLRMANRMSYNDIFSDKVRAAYAGGPPVLVESRILEPLGRKKPSVIGVQYMGDLFHEDVPTHYIADVWNVMRQCPQHTFLVLTKRSCPMLSILTDWGVVLPNVHLGVSVENQVTADERIPLLLQTPAAVRFVSLEPLLGVVDLEDCLPRDICATCGWEGRIESDKCPDCDSECCMGYAPGLDWVIVGGESGPGARPMHPDWARSIRDQCIAAGVPYFHKQNGAWLHYSQITNDEQHEAWSMATQYYTWPDWSGDSFSARMGKKVAGRQLDGREWNEMPRRES